ncbi:MAG: hypothetical protein JWQ76_647 [Ramlibacter sp.]|nr:hypothetical protein [Ramlibacter sp.]
MHSLSAAASAAARATSLNLSEFISVHSDEILAAWDDFAATLAHQGTALDKRALRDHAAQILATIALDLEQPQSADEQAAKSKGQGVHEYGRTAAEVHADFRMMAGFPIDAMITEYRALRASVLRIWTSAGGGTSPRDLRDLTRFNEAIDQSIAESVIRYTDQTRRSTDLFIGILGHDIRNPLGTIVMSIEVLVRSGQLNARAAEPIVNSAVRINSIIEQVVDFARAQADGLMPIRRRPGNLSEQVMKVVQETQVRYPGRTLRVEQTGNFDGSWDEGRIGQLLSNLLGNAFLYGFRQGDVTIRMWSDAKDVTFSVHNEGPAISLRVQERMFEPLVRNATLDGDGERREPAGLGLGLYICREIVMAHGGTLAIESAEEKGTTFVVTLPRFPGP